MRDAPAMPVDTGTVGVISAPAFRHEGGAKSVRQMATIHLPGDGGLVDFLSWTVPLRPV